MTSKVVKPFEKASSLCKFAFPWVSFSLCSYDTEGICPMHTNCRSEHAKQRHMLANDGKYGEQVNEFTAELKRLNGPNLLSIAIACKGFPLAILQLL